MNDISFDETLEALAGAGLVDSVAAEPPAPGASGQPGADLAGSVAASAPEGSGPESPEESGGLLNGLLGGGGLLGNAAPMMAAAFVGSKMSGGKSTGNPVADVVTTVTKTVGADGKTTETKSSQPSAKKKGLLEAVKAVPEMAAAPVQNAVQAMLEEFAGTSGSGSLAGEFASAMQSIREKSDRPLPKIGEILPSAAKSVTEFLP